MRALLFFFLTTTGALLSWGAEKDPPLPPPPPMPQAVMVSLYQGESVEIPLRGVGRVPSQLRFLVRSKPSSGTLGEIRLTGRNTAVVVYTHDGKSGPGVDVFTYAVQNSDSPVSAPGKVQIHIAEKPPQLETETQLDFGTVLLGDTTVQDLVLHNAGGGYLSGTLSIPEGWRLQGPANYHIAAGKKAAFTLAFHPDEERKYTGRIRFSHSTQDFVDLRGEGVSPFEFSPDETLELSDTAPRSGTISIENRTDEDRTLQITASPQLEVPDAVSLPARGQATVRVTTAPDYLGAVEGKVDFAGNGFLHSVEIRSAAAPPVLAVATDRELDFGTLSTGKGQTFQLTLHNSGGSDARLRWDMSTDIRVVPDGNAVVLAPGEKREFEITIEPSRTGRFEETLTIGARGAEPVVLTLTGTVAAPKIPRLDLPENLTVPHPGEALTAETPAPQIPLPSKPGSLTIKALPAPPGTVIIAWDKPLQGSRSYVIEERRLRPAAPGRPPESEWLPWENWTIEERDNQITARMDHLPRGRMWFLRVVGIDENGRRSEPSPVFRVATHPPPPNLIPWIAGAMVIAAAGFWFVRQYRRRSAQAAHQEAGRMSNLETPP